MVSDKVKNFLVMYFALLMPLIMFFIAVLTGANILIFLLILAWIGGGFMIVFLPTHSEKSEF